MEVYIRPKTVPSKQFNYSLVVGCLGTLAHPLSPEAPQQHAVINNTLLFLKLYYNNNRDKLKTKEGEEMADLNKARDKAVKDTVDRLDANGYIVGPIARKVIKGRVEAAMVALTLGPEFQELQDEIEQVLIDEQLLMK